MRYEKVVLIDVSIHAPVRVRQGQKLVDGVKISFNSRTREGATPSVKFPYWSNQGFNSRTREGATPSVKFPYWSNQGFNSRTREGATTESVELFALGEFQFTHP